MARSSSKMIQIQIESSGFLILFFIIIIYLMHPQGDRCVCSRVIKCKPIIREEMRRRIVIGRESFKISNSLTKDASMLRYIWCVFHHYLRVRI